MYAISFDMTITSLKKYYGESYHNAYYEIKIVLRNYGFHNVQGSVYLAKTANMANLFEAVMALKKLSWFRKSVRDIKAFKVEDWSEFTDIVKRED